MTTNKQRRAAAKRKLQRQNERRTRQAAARRRTGAVVGVVVAVLVIAGGIWIGVSVAGGNDASTAAHGSQSAATPSNDTAAPSDTGSDSATDALCAYPASGTAAKQVHPPTDLNPPTSGTVTANVTLNSGSMTLALDRSGTPCAVNSFASLADQGYFDDTPCHRLTDSPSLKVLQCGDPSGTGSGGPGYSFADELSGDETYDRGTIAMANAGPDTNGSQFFLVYGDSQLPASYDVLGTISGGMDVLDAIADAGIDGGGQDGAPAEPVTIDSITLGS